MRFHGLEHHHVENVELKPQRLARCQHWPHHRLQSRPIDSELDYPSLEYRDRHAADLQAERIEGATDFVLQRDAARLQGFAIGQQQPQFLALGRLNMDRGVPADAYRLRNRPRVVAVGLDGHYRGRALHAPGFDVYRRQTGGLQPLAQPGRQGPGFQAQAFDRNCERAQPSCDRLRLSFYLAFLQNAASRPKRSTGIASALSQVAIASGSVSTLPSFRMSPASSTMQMAVSSSDTSKPTKYDTTSSG